MKKILAVLVLMTILVGCSSDNEQTLFIKGPKDKYGLYTVEGKEKTKFEYDQVTKVGSNGYVVVKKDKYGYISNNGKQLIELGKYKELVVNQEMIIGKDKDDKITIFDSNAKELYKDSDKTKINIDGLPIIKQNKQYLVLSQGGKTYLTTKKEVKYAAIYEEKYIQIGYNNAFSIKDSSLKDAKDIVIETKDVFGLMAYNPEVGYLLYSNDAHIIKLIDNTGKELFSVSKEADKVYFDANKNVVAIKDNKVTLISNNGDKLVDMDSYYTNLNKFIDKNDTLIYGPHNFNQDGKVNEVKEVQLDPLGSFVKEDIFPVYVRQVGFQYYNFEGKQVIDQTFKKTSLFDKNTRAIVSKEDKKFYLIDKSGKKVSNQYVNLELINEDYYAGYTTASKYEVIDKDGKKIIDDSFMGSDKEIFTYEGIIYGIFGRNGKSYVYDLTQKTVVFEFEGQLVFEQTGYFIGNQKTYFSMKGKEIYSR